MRLFPARHERREGRGVEEYMEGEEEQESGGWGECRVTVWSLCVACVSAGAADRKAHLLGASVYLGLQNGGLLQLECFSLKKCFLVL